MTNLSPVSRLTSAAQAAIDAWWNASDGEYIDGVWTPNRSAQLAAALEAVADQVVPKDLDPSGDWTDKDEVRYQLLAIAAELRHHNANLSSSLTNCTTTINHED